MKSKINEYIANLISYDYILFGVVFFIFILFIILGILLRKKLLLAVILIFLSFLVLILGPTVGRGIMHSIIFENSTTLVSEKKLLFTKAVVIRGSLTNESNKNFKTCKITANIYKASSNKLKNYLYGFKSFQHMSIIENNISIAQTKEFKIIVEPFTYERKYNISLGAKCK